jgi:hypothetical protein
MVFLSRVAELTAPDPGAVSYAGIKGLVICNKSAVRVLAIGRPLRAKSLSMAPVRREHCCFEMGNSRLAGDRYQVPEQARPDAETLASVIDEERHLRTLPRQCSIFLSSGVLFRSI